MIGLRDIISGDFWKRGMSFLPRLHCGYEPDARSRGVAVRKPRAAAVCLAALLLAAPAAVRPAAPSAGTPQSVAELWADFDPRKDPLEAEVIREWKSDGIVFRSVRFLVGTFKGKPARMAAIYGFPENATLPLPALMQIHGGGGRASTTEGLIAMVNRGYAVLSVNWGGSRGGGQREVNTVETAQPGDPNTDWGAVDPTQLNQGRMDSMLPGPKQLFEDREHPKNANWYLLTLGCRRGLTFLEQQKEVDPARLGVFGYLLNVGLTSEGLIPQASLDRLAEIGAWMKVNDEAIHGSGATPFGAEAGSFSSTEKDQNGKPVFIPEWIWRATTKPGHIYLLVFAWPADGKFTVPTVARQLTGATLLADPSAKLIVTQNEQRTTVSGLPAKAPDAVATVIDLKF